MSLSCCSFAFPCHSLSLPVSEVNMVPPACPHCQIGLGSRLGLPNLVKLPCAACPAELSPADFRDVEDTGLREEWCMAGCWVTCSPRCCSVAGGCQCHVVPVGKGLPAGSQAHRPKAAKCHPEACSVLWAMEVRRDKLACPLERGSCVYRCTKGWVNEQGFLHVNQTAGLSEP